MKCIYHNDREAEFVCTSCGQPVCRECATVINGKNVCKACAYKNMQQIQEQYRYNRSGDGVNGFLFFIYLAVPGLRHMYLGLMKRGLGFLVTFFGLIGLSIILEGLAGILVPVIFIAWFYSAFDSYQCRKLLSKGEQVEDKELFKGYGLETIKEFFVKRKTLSGVAVILLGVYLLFKQIVRYGYRRYVPDIIITMIDFTTDSIVPLLLIIGGIYLLTRVGGRAHSEKENSEVE